MPTPTWARHAHTHLGQACPHPPGPGMPTPTWARHVIRGAMWSLGGHRPRWRGVDDACIFILPWCRAVGAGALNARPSGTEAVRRSGRPGRSGWGSFLAAPAGCERQARKTEGKILSCANPANPPPPLTLLPAPPQSAGSTKAGPPPHLLHTGRPVPPHLLPALLEALAEGVGRALGACRAVELPRARRLGRFAVQPAVAPHGAEAVRQAAVLAAGHTVVARRRAIAVFGLRLGHPAGDGERGAVAPRGRPRAAVSTGPRQAVRTAAGTGVPSCNGIRGAAARAAR
eukprot:366127-Chlamydomonas_euryale.AAC.6